MLTSIEPRWKSWKNFGQNCSIKKLAKWDEKKACLKFDEGGPSYLFFALKEVFNKFLSWFLEHCEVINEETDQTRVLTKFGLLSQSTWNIKKSIRPTKSQNICQIVFAPGFILISKEVAIFCLFSENVKYFKLLDYMHLKNYCSYKYWMWVILSWNTLLKVDSKICAFRPCCIVGILKQCDMGFGLCHVGGLLRNIVKSAATRNGWMFLFHYVKPTFYLRWL